MTAPVIAEVVLARGEDVDFALKRLKKFMVKAGIFGELKRRTFYRKPSEARRYKSQRARHKLRKAMLRRAQATEVKPSPSNGG